MPLNKKITVRGILKNKEEVESAYSGKLCEVKVKAPRDFDTQFLRAGQVLCDPNYPVH